MKIPSKDLKKLLNTDKQKPTKKIKTIPAVREKYPEDIPNLDGSGTIEPLIQKLFARLKFHAQIAQMGVAQVQCHPTYIDFILEEHKFRIQITEI